MVGFTTVTVFDVAQTDGQALPERPVLRLPDGQAPQGLWEALVAGVHLRGFTVDREDPAPAFGLTRWATRRVQVAPDVSPAMACHVLAHELGHIAADHQARPELAGGVREAEADGIAYLLTHAAGLSSHFSVDYVTGWTGGDAGLVRATAARVVTVAAELISSLGLDSLDSLDPNRPGCEPAFTPPAPGPVGDPGTPEPRA